ncbi:MAG TPA: universal stress protein, partial [Kiloniellaceae bacterium]|nr:universal stress protein [Kiloniellaceae bacterium]
LHVMWRGPSLDQLRRSVDMNQLSEKARDELDPEQHPVAEHVNSKIVAPVITKATRKEIGQQILERGKRLAEAKGVDAPKLLLRDGDPARAIVNFARRENADLIVMGSRGLGRVEDLFAGSISYKIVHTTKKSCMVVR